MRTIGIVTISVLLSRSGSDRFMFDCRGGTGKVNQFFVAERLCSARQINGNEQDSACVSREINNCSIWPNPDIPLPNVTDTMREVIDELGYLSCVKETRSAFPLSVSLSAKRLILIDPTETSAAAAAIPSRPIPPRSNANSRRATRLKSSISHNLTDFHASNLSYDTESLFCGQSIE